VKVAGDGNDPVVRRPRRPQRNSRLLPASFGKPAPFAHGN